MALNHIQRPRLHPRPRPIPPMLDFSRELDFPPIRILSPSERGSFMEIERMTLVEELSFHHQSFDAMYDAQVSDESVFNSEWVSITMHVLDVLKVEHVENSTCSICLEEESGPRLHTVCNHLFHPECIKKWVGMGKVTCPNCRATI